MTTQPFFIPAVLIALLSLPLIVGFMPRQGGYGYRTPKTLSNDPIWYAANRMAGICFLVSSFFYLGIAAFFPGSPDAGKNFGIWLLHLFSFAGPLFVSFLLVRNYVEKL